MHFTKMQGLGNDYIYVNLFEEKVPCPEKTARLISDRHFGVGSDGLVLICPPDHPEADFRMRMFNADGSEGKMCGNAARCIAKYVYERGLTQKKQILLETKSGLRKMEMVTEGNRVRSVCVDMGKPDFRDEAVPVIQPEVPGMFPELEELGRGYCVSIGNPHCVVFLEKGRDLSRLPVSEYGEAIQHSSSFPESVNLEIVQTREDGTLSMRVYERGAGETMACGTGACAVLVCAVHAGLSPRENVIHLRGGDLTVHYREDQHIIMEGPAAFICEGEWEEINED